MPANMTTHTDTELDTARRALLTEATAADLRRFTLRHTGRVQLAQRIEQAAAHLLAQRQGGAS